MTINLTEIRAFLADFQDYKLILRNAEPFYVLYDRTGGPIVQGNTEGEIFADALDLLDEHDDTGLLGACTLGDFEAMERMLKFLAKQTPIEVTQHLQLAA